MHAPLKSALRETSLAAQLHAAHEFRRVLRQAVVYDRIITAERVAQLSGVGWRTVQSYMEVDRIVEPPVSSALAILCVIGNPYFREYMLSTVGWDAFPHDEAEATPIITLVPDGMKHFAVIAEVVADGRIDHVEAPHFERACDGMVGTFVGHSSVARAV
jgi:hypothetical protein